MKISTKPIRVLSQVIRMSIYQLILSLTFASIAVADNVTAQELLNKRITLNLDGEKVSVALKQIGRQASVRIMYSPQIINVDRKVTLNVRNERLATVLESLLNPLNIGYEVEGEQLILNALPPKKTAIQPEPAESKILDRPVKGTVKDQKGDGLPGVSIVVKGSQRGALTDTKGRFEINLVEDNEILIFSFVGYTTQEVPTGNQSNFEILLKEDLKALEEVVVVGYGTQRSKDLTGAVATINQKTIRDLPVSTVDQKMIGQVAGVQIQQVSGAPGAGTSVKIRGSGSLGAGNEPLYVVDGMPYSSGMNQTLNPLIYINPNDIESITILKDASSTAIYGSRGANGVIVITTKKGNYDRTEITVSSMRGVQRVPQKGRPIMMNQAEFALLQQDKIGIRVRQLEKREPTLADYPEEYRNPGSLQGNGTDWYDLLLRPAAIQDHSINIQKGTKETRMNLSLGYFKQDGVMKHTSVDRYTAKLGVDSDLSKSVRISASLQPTFINQNRTNTNQDRTDVLGLGIWANPIMKPYDENGKLIPYLVSPQNKYYSTWSFANPLFILQETAQSQNNFQNLGSAAVEWDILPGLRAKSSISTIWTMSKFSQYVPGTVGGANTPPNGIGRSSASRGNSFNWLIENILTYNKSVKEHKFDALLGYTTQKSTSNSIDLSASPYPNDLIKTINAAQTINGWGEGMSEWSMISYLGRANYSFKDRYLLTATFRSDGSSRFGPRNRYALFPSVAVAWRLSEEAFIKRAKVISDLKMRLSYGRSGNNNIGNYSHLASISANSYIFGSTQVTASTVGLSNPFLTWEESEQTDAGIDLALFDNRLTLVLDYYHRKSKNMLLNDVIPAITGYTSQTVNKGSVQNNGIEVGLGISPVVGKFNWDLNMNFAANRNKILALNDNNDRILSGNNDGFPSHVSVVGKPLGQFFGFQFERLYNDADMQNPELIKTAQVYPGNAKYADIDGDGLVSDLLDYTMLGSPHPDFIFGITNNFSYKRLSLNVIVNGQQGGRVINGLRQTVDNIAGHFNPSKEWVNRWRSAEDPGDGKHYGVPQLSPTWGHRFSNLWIENASYLRISNVSLSYSIPENLVQKTKFINNCRFYLTIQNLAIFTKYTGANPEAQASNVSNTLAPGFDMTSYPLSRTTSIGVNLNF